MYRSLFLSMMLAAVPLLVGCGTSYPGDRQDWLLVASPNNPNPDGEVFTSGNLNLFPPSDVSEGCRLTEDFSAAPTVLSPNGFKLSIFWEGSWTGGKEGAELSLSCTLASAENLELLDCDTATLKLSCEVVGEKLDCGDYVFK